MRPLLGHKHIFDTLAFYLSDAFQEGSTRNRLSGFPRLGFVYAAQAAFGGAVTAQPKSLAASSHTIDI